jgi:hypothetical protein
MTCFFPSPSDDTTSDVVLSSRHLATAAHCPSLTTIRDTSAVSVP